MRGGAVKILLLAPQPFYEERGTPIAVDLLLKALSDRGESVDVLTYPIGEDRQYPGVTLHRLPKIPGIRKVKPGPSFPKIVCDVVMMFRAARMARRTRYDVVHAVEESVFMAWWLRRWRRLPYVYDMDSCMSRQIVDKFRWLGLFAAIMMGCEGVAIRAAEAVVPVCESLEDEARRQSARKTFRLSDISLLRKTAPTEAERALFPPAEAGCRLVYVGNLESYQGIDLLLESFRRLGADPAAPPAQLIVAGGVPADVARYRARCAELGIAARVRFLGPQPVERLGALLELADVVVSPRTQGNNTPMKIYSYMASGKPILATDLATHTQVLTPEIALLASPAPQAFAEAMGRLVADADLRRRLGAAAQAEAERNYSPDAFRRNVNQIYDWIGGQLKPA